MTTTPARSVRVPDHLWDAVTTRAAHQGHTVSEIIRDALTSYITNDLNDEPDSPVPSVKP